MNIHLETAYFRMEVSAVSNQPAFYFTVLDRGIIGELL